MKNVELPETVELFGGPLDGKVVPFLGTRYEQVTKYLPGNCYDVAVYVWNVDGEKIVGEFKKTKHRRFPQRSR